MKRKLLKQINNEWRSNLWLAVELLVVSVVMWFIADSLTVTAIQVTTPMGVETDNCFLLSYGQVPSWSQEYEHADSTYETMLTDFYDIVGRLRSNPDIECVAFGRGTAVPYTFNSWTVYGFAADGKDSLCTGYCGWREVSPDYIRLFRIRGANGETPDEMAGILARNEALFASDIYTFDESDRRDMTQEQIIDDYLKKITGPDKSHLVGRIFKFTTNDTVPLRIGGIVRPIKRSEYEASNAALLTLLDESNGNYMQSYTIIRARPGKADKVAEDLRSQSTTLYRSGNIYLKSIKPFSTLRKEVQSEPDEQVRNLVVIMLFLMASIFLGLLGTFWFRTQQRVSEIAIRMVNGATRGSVFRRLIGEGVLLLVIVTPVAAAFDWLLCHYQFNSSIYGFDHFVPLRFAATVAITFGLMALMITIGVWFPAYKAMRIEPAIALKDE